MKRLAASTLLLALGLGTAGLGSAQDRGRVPVVEDLQRREAVDARIEGRPQRPVGIGTGNLPPQSDPSGVAGFNGPPGGIGDSVGSYGALPQGATGADIR